MMAMTLSCYKSQKNIADVISLYNNNLRKESTQGKAVKKLKLFWYGYIM